MTRRRSLRVAQREATLFPRIAQLKAEHPFWGDRRVWAYRRFVEHLPVNRKRLLRRMQEHYLLVPPNRRLKAKRTPRHSEPKPLKPHEWWGIDMTTGLVQGFGWVYVVVVFDWYTTKLVGHAVGIQGAARHWLAALDRAVNQQCPDGVRGQGVSLLRDNGCQPTSLAFMEVCSALGLHHACTSDGHPQGNADTERFRRTLKEACLWLQEWTCPFERSRVCEGWIAHDNEPSRHSTLGDKPPVQFEREDYRSHGPPFLAA